MLTLAAVPNDGNRFVGWGGDCSGTGLCELRGGQRVTATFAQAMLHVRVEGSGTVSSSDGRSCRSDCEWAPQSEVELFATPDATSTFVGFAGACSGNAPCRIARGEVTAKFVGVSELRLQISGDGIGTVEAGGQTCSTDCSLSLVSGQSYPVRIIPGSNSVLSRVGGACASQPCIVTPPGVLEVEFSLSRVLSVTVSGGARGQVLLDGQPFCAAGTCTAMIPAASTVTLTGIRGDDAVSFRGFSGASCSGPGPCAVAPGVSPAMVSASFESVIAWRRTFDAEGPVLFADEDGLVIALLARQFIDIDGVRYTVNSAAAPTFSVLAEFDWDAGTKWLIPLNQHVNTDANPLPTLASAVRAPNGEVLVSGACSQGRINGQAQCNGEDTPLVISVVDGGVNWLITDTAFGTGGSNSGAGIIDLTVMDGGVVAFRGTGAFWGNNEGGLGWVGAFDGGFAPAFSRTQLQYGILPWTDACGRANDRLRCIFTHAGAFSLDDCTFPASGMVLDALLLEFDHSLRCVQGHRILGQRGNVSGPSASFDAGHTYVTGYGGPLDFGGGITTSSVVGWLSEWTPTGTQRVGFSSVVSTGTGLAPIQVEPFFAEEVLLQFRIGPLGTTNIWGATYDRGSVGFVFIDAQDLTTPKRWWKFSTPDNTSNSLLSTRFFVVGDKVAVLITGREVSFGDTLLSTTTGTQSHLVVLQP